MEYVLIFFLLLILAIVDVKENITTSKKDTTKIDKLEKILVK